MILVVNTIIVYRGKKKSRGLGMHIKYSTITGGEGRMFFYLLYNKKKMKEETDKCNPVVGTVFFLPTKIIVGSAH